ncbi:MAG: hypothetical protein EB051_01625, partial [Chlamydiia bacterium]|nr:hypothetical protein [Chlamydiia bacterium]
MYLPLDIIVKKKSLYRIVFIRLSVLKTAFSCLLAFCHGNVTSFCKGNGIMATDSFVVDACAVLSEDIDRLEPLIQQLEKASSWDQKIQYLYSDPVVKRYLSGPSLIKTALATLSLRDAYLILSVIALGQAELVFNPKHLSDQEYAERITDLIDSLVVVEKFYAEIGGIIGYHLSMIKCLCRPQERS